MHGWQQDKKSFAPLTPFLFKRYHLYLLDLPGFGGSEFPPENFNSFDYAEAVAEWIKNKNLKDIILVGHSFGGKVAAIVAKQNRKLVEKLILIAGSGIVENEKHASLKKILPDFVKNLLRPHLVGRDYKEAGKLLPIFRTIIKEDISGVFRKIKTPTLIIWGKDDKELPVEIGVKMNKMIGGSRLDIIAGGHFPFWDNPQETTELIKNFINENN
mgnify:CR=1 FL=1